MNESFENKSTELQRLEEQNKISKESYNFLSSQINFFKKDGILTEDEQDYLNKQVKNHEIFQKKYNTYIQNKVILTEKSKSNLEELAKIIFSKNISSNELKLFENAYKYHKKKVENSYLKDSYKDYFKDNYRDYIEANVDIKGTFEDLYQQKNINQFLREFTKDYLDFFEMYHNDSDIKKKHKNKENGLIIDQKTLELLIYKTIRDNKIYSILNNQIEFRIQGGKKVLLDIAEIINKLDKEILRDYNLQLVKKSLDGDFTKSDRKYIKSILRLENISDEELKIKFLKFGIENSLVSKNEILSNFEKKKSFNYLEFLDTFGLTENLEKFYLEMIKRHLNISDDEIEGLGSEMVNNLLVLTKITLGIETNGENINNNQGSRAKGYFQIMVQNKKGFSRKNGNYNSFDTALRRYYRDFSGRKYFPNLKLPKNENVPEWVINAYNTKNFDPKKLTAEQQNELFIVDIFNNGLKKENAYVEEYLKLNAYGNLRGLGKVYSLFHHTQTSQSNTKEVLLKYKRIYQDELIILK